MKKIKFYLLLVILLILQSTVLHKISVFGVFPNIVFVYAILYSSVNNGLDAACFSFVTGLLLDLLTGKTIGLNAILVMYIGYLVSLAGKKFFYENPLYCMLLVFVTTFVYQSIYCILNYVIWQIGDYSSAFLPILIEAVYNSLAGLLLYFTSIRKSAAM